MSDPEKCSSCSNNRKDHPKKFRNQNKKCIDCLNKRKQINMSSVVEKCVSCQNNRKDHPQKFNNKNKTCNDCLNKRRDTNKKEKKRCTLCKVNKIRNKSKNNENLQQLCRECLDKEKSASSPVTLVTPPINLPPIVTTSLIIPSKINKNMNPNNILLTTNKNLISPTKLTSANNNNFLIEKPPETIKQEPSPTAQMEITTPTSDESAECCSKCSLSKLDHPLKFENNNPICNDCIMNKNGATKKTKKNKSNNTAKHSLHTQKKPKIENFPVVHEEPIKLVSEEHSFGHRDNNIQSMPNLSIHPKENAFFATVHDISPKQGGIFDLDNLHQQKNPRLNINLEEIKDNFLFLEDPEFSKVMNEN